MIKLTYTERQKAMTEFRKDPSMDVYTIKREDGSFITVTRSNQVLNWRKADERKVNNALC
jgi:hypothetical protein